MQILLTKYVNKMQTNAQREKIAEKKSSTK